MAVAFLESVISQFPFGPPDPPGVSATHSFSFTPTAQPFFAVALAFTGSGGIAVHTTSMTYAGASMSNVLSFDASQFGGFANLDIHFLDNPPGGFGSPLTIAGVWDNLSNQPGMCIMTFSEGQNSNFTGTDTALNFDTTVQSSLTTSGTAGFHCDIVVIRHSGSVAGTTPDAGQTSRGGISTIPSARSVFVSTKPGQASDTTMGWSGISPTTGPSHTTAHGCFTIAPEAVVGGFDGVEFTAEGSNKPEEPGFPGAPAFPSFGSAPSASPYDALKKGVQVEALLNNAKFI